MSQPSRLDISFSQSSLLFPARSSPFICFTDGLEVIISLCIQMYRGKSIRQAALLVNWERARCRLGHETEQLEDSAVEKHPIPFGILFIGTILQTIKILGFQGMVWIKVWAAAYSLSFVVLAMVSFLAPKDWRDNPPEVSVTEQDTIWTFGNMSKGLCYVALAAQFVCCGWIFNIILGLPASDHPSTEESDYIVSSLATEFAPLVVLLLLGSLIAGIAILAPAAVIWGLSEHFAVRRFLSRYLGECLSGTLYVMFVLVWIVVWVFLWIFSIIRIYDSSNIESQGSDHTVLALAWKLIRGCANLLMYIGFMFQIKSLVDSEQEEIPIMKKLRPILKRKGLLVIFACWIFFEAFLYYRLRFDPQGTVKPSWTDKLG